ncbi:MAG: 4Fe-4S dicluster domain-containing protein [Dehalococcoidia bacterium]|nr:4Fe-4S dicluster domain-containing protein [Dehalococcoidia bacterium]
MNRSKKEYSRRSFIKLLGVAGIGAIAVPGIASTAKDLYTKFKVDQTLQETPHKPKRLRQWVMVIDLKKCDGCESIDGVAKCTEACIKGHMIPTPGGKWTQQWIQVLKQELPGGGSFHMPVPCQQCENAPCNNVCPVGATFQTPEGIILIDHTKCIGCRLCMAACPYSRRFMNWEEPQQSAEAAFVKYSPEYPVPFKRGTVVKCIFCAHNTHQGKLPVCVQGCPMKAIYFGDKEEDIASNGIEIVRLSRFLSENNAFRYKEDLGTQPRVYYLPGHGQEFGRHYEGK